VIKLTDIASSAFINEGANNVKDMFSFLKAKAKKSDKIIIILDEVDALLKKRDQASSSGSAEDTKIVNVFLSEMS
jgi:cell division protease FtsH